MATGKAPAINEDLLTCEICTELLKRAKILNCGHTFCQVCLERWAKMNRGRQLTCPNCRAPWQIPEGGVEKLQSNFHLNRLVDSVLENKKEGEGSNECNRHPGSQLKFYCQTCSVPICTDCTIIEHQPPLHKLVYLSDAEKETRNRMKRNPIPRQSYKEHQLNNTPTPTSPSFPGSAPRSPSFLKLTECNWYAGKMERDVAKQSLTGLPNGTFLVRDSESAGGFVISVSINDRVKHLKVMMRKDGSYIVSSNVSFTSLQELVDYYMQNIMPIPDIKTTLKFPIRTLKKNLSVRSQKYSSCY